MSLVRKTHPGYYGVLMAVAVPWYLGLGLMFAIQGDTLLRLPSYRLVFHYVPALPWATLYFVVGMTIVVGANVPWVPHKIVRSACFVGLGLTLFFLATFIIYDIVNGVPTGTQIPAFLAMSLVEYRAAVEAERNPAMIHAPLPRRRR